MLTRGCRVLAWLCPSCDRWVKPRRFLPMVGMCRSCKRFVARERS